MASKPAGTHQASPTFNMGCFGVILSDHLPLTQVKAVCTTFEAAHAQRTRLDLGTFIVVLHSNPTKHLNTDMMLAVATEAFTEIANHHSSTVLFGTVHTIISTQLMDGAPLITVENILGDVAQSINRVGEIREWYIKKHFKKQKPRALNCCPLILPYTADLKQTPRAALACRGQDPRPGFPG